MKMTRRRLAVSALVPVAAMAQTAAVQAPSDAPDELLKNARQLVRRNGETLTKFQVPVATEPAFQFKP